MMNINKLKTNSKTMAQISIAALTGLFLFTGVATAGVQDYWLGINQINNTTKDTWTIATRADPSKVLLTVDKGTSSGSLKFKNNTYYALCKTNVKTNTKCFYLNIDDMKSYNVDILAYTESSPFRVHTFKLCTNGTAGCHTNPNLRLESLGIDGQTAKLIIPMVQQADDSLQQ